MEVKFVKIKSIKKVGVRNCYDVNSPGTGNYIANGFVVHNSSGISRMCKDVNVSSFDDVAAINALYRPGPLRSGIAAKYSKRKSEGFDEENVILREITNNTFGLIIYQEQLMRIFNELAGFPMNEVQKIRKLVAKSKGTEAINKYRDGFIKGAVENKLSKKDAVKLFDDLCQFGCLPGTSKVDGPDSPVSIFRLLGDIRDGKEPMILSYDIDTKTPVVNRVKKIHDTGVQECFKVEFEDCKLTVSGRENVLTSDGWRMMAELAVGSSVIFS